MLLALDTRLSSDSYSFFLKNPFFTELFNVFLTVHHELTIY